MALKAVATNKALTPTLGELLGDAVRLLRRDFYQRAQGLKLTPALARLLFYVHHESGSSQVDLAARLEITAVTLGRMVDRLVKCGYVRRVPDMHDRRVFRVFVDRAGEPLVVRMAELSTQTATLAMQGLSKRERSELAAHLVKICSNLANREQTSRERTTREASNAGREAPNKVA